MKKKLLCCLSCLMFVLLAAVSQAAIPYTADLHLHYVADDLNLQNGDAVNVWPDSNVGLDDESLFSEAPFFAPQYVAGALNGHAAVKFVSNATADPNTQTMLTTAADTLEYWGDASTGVCVFIVCTGGDADREQRVFQMGRTRAVSNDAKSIICDLSAGQSGNRFNNGRGVANNVFKKGQWIISIHEVAKNQNPSSSFFAVDSTSQIPFTSTANDAAFAPYSSANEAMMGSVTDKAGNWRPGYNGMVAEVIVYRQTLAEINKQLVLDYLYNKYATPGAHNPSPAQNAKSQGTVNGSTLDVNLSWTTGTAADITQHYLYISPNDPNFDNPTVVTLPLGTTNYALTGLTYDSTVFWRVDESVLNSEPNSPNTLKGWVWQFETIPSTPVITAHPVQTSAFPGGTAQFSVTATSVSPETYAWFYSADATQDASDTPLNKFASLLTLSGAEITAASEGYYYCKVSNSSGITVQSNTAKLGVKRKVAHWKLDSDAANWDGTKYIDASGEGHHVDPNTITPQFVAGVNASTNQSVDFDDNKESCGTTGLTTDLWAPAFGTGETTVSLWFNLDRVTGFWQGVVTSRGTEGNNFLVEILPSGKIQLNTQGYYGESACVAPVPVNEWTHVALVMNSTADKIYLNGELVKVFPLANNAPVPQHETQFTIGCLGWTASAGPSKWIFPGNLDDIQVYNYSLSQAQVIDIYDAVLPGDSFCVLNDKAEELEFDFAGGGVNGDEPDCQVNLKDFAVLAASWLNCAYYPYVGCE